MVLSFCLILITLAYYYSQALKVSISWLSADMLACAMMLHILYKRDNF